MTTFPLAILLIWFMPSNRTSADHVLYLWNIMVRECYDILPVITLSKPKAQSKTECKRWKILIIFPPYAWWLASSGRARKSEWFEIWKIYLLPSNLLRMFVPSFVYSTLFCLFANFIQVTIWIPALLKY